MSTPDHDGQGGASELQDSRVCTVIGRRIGLPSIPLDASLYSTARAWLRDDPAALAAEQASRCTPKRQRAPELHNLGQSGQGATDVDAPPLPKRVALARARPVPRAVPDGMLNSATDMPTPIVRMTDLRDYVKTATARG